MGAMMENKDVACYLVTKHSWKGKYKRIFSIGTTCVTTYNPSTFEQTNQWPYSEFGGVKPAPRVGGGPGEFVIHMKQKKKTDTMRFSSDYTADILTDALKFRDQFADPPKPYRRWNVYKQHWSSNRTPAILEVRENAIRQIDCQTGIALADYYFKDIQEFIKVSDCAGGFIIVTNVERRMHFFICSQVDEVIQCANASATENIGYSCRVAKDLITVRAFSDQRLGKCGSELHLTSLVEFTVYKNSTRHKDPMRRILCLSESCILERDPSTYAVVTIHPLGKIYALIRNEENPQLFYVEYLSGERRCYTSTDRDNILAALLDGVRAAGNHDVHVKMRPTDRALRLIPFTCILDEDAESQHARLLFSPPAGLKTAEALERFNSNVPYGGLLYSVTQDGLFSENKEKLIVSCLAGIVDRDITMSLSDWELFFHALRRLFASKAGFHAFSTVPRLREKLGGHVVSALKLNNEAVTHAAIDMLCCLMQPMHSNYELRQEQLNKTSLLSSKAFLEHLMDVMVHNVERNSGALVISSMLDFLTYALCAPYSETTVGERFDILLELVAARGRVLYKLFQFPSMTIVKGAGLIMRALIEEADSVTSTNLQELALAEGALLRHLHIALFTQSKDVRMLTNRQLSRHLVMLWATGNETTMQLLKRILPPGLLRSLDSTDEVPVAEEEMLMIRNNLDIAVNESDRKANVVKEQLMQMQRAMEKHLDSLLQHWSLRQKLDFLKREEKVQQPVVLRRRRERVKSKANWKLFFYMFGRDFARSDLIWTHKTREELREALENEMRLLNADRELTLGVPISWNHAEFEVYYPSLAAEIKVGDYYLRILLDEHRNNQSQTPIVCPKDFFNEIYHHFLLSTKVEMRCLCLQAMAVTYERYYNEIGQFYDAKYFVHMLEKCHDFGERDAFVQLIGSLCLNKANVREIVSANGVRTLIDFVTLAHLHTSRAYVPTQANVIECAPDASRKGAKEWFYSISDNDRHGPISFDEMRELFNDQKINEKTKCWAQGLDGWKALHAIPQLRWTMLATGTPTMNESELAVAILGIFIRMVEFFPGRDPDGCVIRPIAKVKHVLSDTTCLPHIVQLLLTFDPTIVEKTAKLLYLVTEDNPLISRLYLSGVFYFILMYTGSNVLPIARFLHYAHMKQSFRSDQNISSIIQCSVLSSMLPEAAVFYLENYGPEKYAEVFLGEFDHPEIIWNSEMRRYMIEKIATHVSDFSPRLPSNVKALYQYCPIGSIDFPQLTNELFCYIYYLRHLCDTVKFPSWPIKDPVTFLKACLSLWNEEVDRKPPSITTEEACETLQINLEDLKSNESVARRAYFKLAQQFHPDKNPEGRPMFEKINQAYEYLCSRSSKSGIGPDPERIVLCIKAQSIVFSRYCTELAPYKYAGYTQLIKTIRLETEDDALFSKTVPLLAACTELCYYTLACSALNAEQLRRENGLEALQEAFTRCVSVITQSSKPNDLAVQVCYYVCRSYATAAQFPACREKLAELSQLFDDLCRVVRFKHLVKLCSVGAECICSLSACSVLQTKMFHSGILWPIIPNMFQYDYTLDEGGVEKTEDTNLQQLQNGLAKASCEACACLGGYIRDCPFNDAVNDTLRAFLGPYFLRLMRTASTDLVLKTMNSNTENPYLIWNAQTRTELLECIERSKHSTITTHATLGAEFIHEAYKDELIIGDIFLRIYNEQPTFIIENPKVFVVDLLDFLANQLQYLFSVLALKLQNGNSNHADASARRIRHAEMATESLKNVLKANPGLEMLCIGHFKLLFGLLRVDASPTLQKRALEVISIAASNQECVGDMARSDGLVYLLLLFHNLLEAVPLVLTTLFTLVSNTKLVKDLLDYGGAVYLLDIFCNHTDGDVRACAAELLGKVQGDKLHGPLWTRMLVKFLPPVFMDAMRDSPKNCVQLFDINTENPELIWNDATRANVRNRIKTMKADLYQRQANQAEFIWKLPDDFQCVYEDTVTGELVIAGVFIRLYIANPSWVLRNPRLFLTELVDCTVREMKVPNIRDEQLEMLTTALVGFLHNQPLMCDQVAAQGYIPRICDAMKSGNRSAARSSILLLQPLSKSKACVEALIAVQCLPAMLTAMQTRPDLLHHSCQGVSSLFEVGNSQLIYQALQCEFVAYLLNLLGSPLESVEQPAAVKAQIVRALKSMASNVDYGEQVQAILNGSAIWAEFRDQKHDLFLTNAPTVGYLGAGAGVAGYLTQSVPQNLSQRLPPP